jgi:anhydro-N-acetylmuramic acid kinase
MIPTIFMGMMSGTSLDGVDGVAAQIEPSGQLRVLAHSFVPFAPAFRDLLMQLNESGPDELHRAALAGNGISRHYAQVAHDLLAQTQLTPSDITALGAHGQTVRHRPLEFDADPATQQAAVGYTIQLINPSLLAELTGMDVVCNFRNRDLSAGGQGAPLVPAFHHGVFGQSDTTVAVLNIGGIANLSVLHPDGSVLGWDCGPGNALMDYWCSIHTGASFDHKGAWSATGIVNPDLLATLMAEPFLQRLPPKSTGRDLFNPAWLKTRLPIDSYRAQDIQATLTEFTAMACAHDIQHQAPLARELIVCGGGALNEQLMRRLAHHLPGLQVTNSQVRGLPPLQVEAAAFAWLAFKTVRRETSSLPSVTGARGARVLGAIYPR